MGMESRECGSNYHIKHASKVSYLIPIYPIPKHKKKPPKVCTTVYNPEWFSLCFGALSAPHHKNYERSAILQY